VHALRAAEEAQARRSMAASATVGVVSIVALLVVLL
jgi:hypothetical protein